MVGLNLQETGREEKSLSQRDSRLTSQFCKIKARRDNLNYLQSILTCSTSHTARNLQCFVPYVRRPSLLYLSLEETISLSCVAQLVERFSC